MNIVTVIPITKSLIKNTLTYFTKEDILKGSIVSVPIRNKKVFGIVLDSQNAEEKKIDLKNLTYQIKKVSNINARRLFSENFMESAREIADYYAGNISSVLFTLIPNTILEQSEKINFEPKEKRSDIFHEVTLLQANNEERYATYKSLIREEFARSHSIFFCMPTTEDLKNAKNSLEKGIEKYTYVLHSGLTKKEIAKLWQEILNETHPVLIIATGQFLSLPRQDIGTIVVEKESSRAYKMISRPFIDMRKVAEIVSKKNNCRLVLGDTLLRVETLWEEKNGAYAQLSPLKFRSLTTSRCTLVDMKIPKDQKKKEFTILGDELKKMITEAKENNEQTFLFCGRKGLSPVTACDDCGTVVTCNNCKSPVVLYNKKTSGDIQKNLFVCHHCGERRDASELCSYCNGWRLTTLGIGSERVYEEVKTIFPDTNVFILDKEHVTTQKQMQKVVEEFYASPGSVLVGTEMALGYLNKKIENVAVVSIDSFFAIPDFRINEKIFHILLDLRDLSEHNFIIQTRQKNTKIFDEALAGNLADFYRDEIDDRKLVGYPPFTTYIKLTLEGDKNAIRKEMEKAKEILAPFELFVFDAWNPGADKKFTIHGLVSQKRGEWVQTELLQKLLSLPPFYMIKIDPDTLL
ncbi:MAG: primosomal protein N' [bacterium]